MLLLGADGLRCQSYVPRYQRAKRDQALRDLQRTRSGTIDKCFQFLFSVLIAKQVGDRLCSALGQDIFECLFSRESLERRPDGTSKILRPFGFFLLALAYNVLHATLLFYQVITLNVAV